MGAVRDLMNNPEWRDGDQRKERICILKILADRIPQHIDTVVFMVERYGEAADVAARECQLMVPVNGCNDNGTKWRQQIRRI